MASRIVSILIVITTMLSVRGQNVDMTLTPGASGAAVVLAVVDKIHSACIFNNDRLLLRRTAYVESLDGTDPKTYRQGFHGGIWQVDQLMLVATTLCGSHIRPQCDLIHAEFGIDWTQVTWDKLRMPFYSGLAASLYIIQVVADQRLLIPGDTAGQAKIWARYYRSNAQEAVYDRLANKATEYECRGKLDLAFIMDMSGSILPSDYILQLDFVSKVVGALPVSPQEVQIANVVFGTGVNVTFHFNTYTNKADIVRDIMATPKDDGGTNTPEALSQTRTIVFNPLNGARPDAKKVAVLLTDGESYDYNLTVKEAEKLRNAGVLVFVIGVGWINLDELLAVASPPVCTRIYVLDNYAHIESILYEIQKSTCEAPVVLKPDTPVSGNIPANGTDITVTATKQDNSSVVAVNSSCSILDIYVSYTNPHPSPALYAEKFTSSEGKPTYLTFTSVADGNPIFVTVVGSRLPKESAALLNCSDYSYQLVLEKQEKVEIVCREKSTIRDCRPQDFAGSNYETLLCGKGQGSIPNPCTPENLGKSLLTHPHPFDNTQFIRCDLLGRMYVTLCPNHEIFNKGTLSCGFDNSNQGDMEKVLLPETYANPCTPSNINSGFMYFAYTPDRHRYIQCDAWGVAWLVKCPSGSIWNDVAHTCVPDILHEFDSTTLIPFQVANPCTVEALNAGNSFFPHPCEHNKYIHCDVSGNYYIQSCPLHMYFDPGSFVCILSDIQKTNPDCLKAGRK